MDETTVAIRAAKEAGKLLRERFGGQQDAKTKAGEEIVTASDLLAERLILDTLRAAYPAYAILSEEAGKHGDAERMWVVDPLDGSTNYSIGNPFFAVSIALAERTVARWDVIMGVVCAPVTKEIFFAERGEGAFRNGEQIAVSREADLSKLLLAYCSPAETHLQRAIQLFSALRPLCRDLNRMRAGALELAYVADGRLGAYLSPGGKPWDAAAGSLLVAEAGGKVTDFQGRDWTVQGDERDIIATNGSVHRKLLDVVEKI